MFDFVEWTTPQGFHITVLSQVEIGKFNMERGSWDWPQKGGRGTISCSLVMKIRSPFLGFISIRPVKDPKAGRIMRFSLTWKHAERTPVRDFPRIEKPGCKCPARWGTLGSSMGWWRQCQLLMHKGSSWHRMSNSCQGSPDCRSWLPRTKCSSISRQFDLQSPSSFLTESLLPCRAWRKSPRKMIFLTWVFSQRVSSFLQSSLEFSSEIGIPTLRKVALLPKWGSATKRVFSAGQWIAFSGSSRKVSFCQIMSRNMKNFKLKIFIFPSLLVFYKYIYFWYSMFIIYKSNYLCLIFFF